MHNRPVIPFSDKAQNFLLEYFDEDGNYLIDYMLHKKHVAVIAKEIRSDVNRVQKKLKRMIRELIAVIESLEE